MTATVVGKMAKSICFCGIPVLGEGVAITNSNLVGCTTGQVGGFIALENAAEQTDVSS
jgi:hypothetical protein